MRRVGVAAAVLLLAVPVGAETLEGEGFRLEVPEGFVRADAGDEATVHAGLLHTYRTGMEVRDEELTVRVFVREAGADVERLVVSRLATATSPPADDPEFLRGQRGALRRTVQEISGTIVRLEPRRLPGGLLVAESLLEGDIPQLGRGTAHALVLPREGFLLSVVLTQRAEPGRDREVAWDRLLASLRSDARPPRPQQRESSAYRAGYVVGQILGVLLLVLLVRWIVRRVRRARREVDAEAGDGPSGPDA